MHTYVLTIFFNSSQGGGFIAHKYGEMGGGGRKICYDYFGCMINLYRMCLNGSSLGM